MVFLFTRVFFFISAALTLKCMNVFSQTDLKCVYFDPGETGNEHRHVLTELFLWGANNFAARVLRGNTVYKKRCSYETDFTIPYYSIPLKPRPPGFGS